MMRRFMLATVIASALLASGCGDGMAIDRRARAERHRRIVDIDMRQFNDDWDTLWLMDEPSRLSPWRVR